MIDYTTHKKTGAECNRTATSRCASDVEPYDADANIFRGKSRAEEPRCRRRSGVTVSWAIKTTLPIVLSASLQACGSSGHNSPPPAPTFTLSGSVSHLDVGGLVITNGTDSLTLAQGATSFSFNTPVASNGSYSVTIATQPVGENCVVSNGSGSGVAANVTNIAIVCNTAITGPTSIGLIPVGPSPVGYRILLPIGMVGDNKVSIDAVLDTGSAGTVLNASRIFPATMVSDAGFVFPAGQTSLTYNGITVTNVSATRTYGSQGAIVTMESGNIGFAQLTFGAGASITTKVVPIFFAYKASVNGVEKDLNSLSDLVGVNATAEAINVSGSPTPAGSQAPFCSQTTTGTCRVASPLRYLTYSAGATGGFIVDKVTLNSCSDVSSGTCPVQAAALTLGLNGTVASGFTTMALDDCGTPDVSDLQNDRICSQVIQGVTVASGAASFAGPAIFDSGEPTIRLSVPAGSNFPTDPATLPSGAMVKVSTSSGFTYQFSAGTGYLTTNVVASSAPTDFSNLGIEFFTQNAFLLNYATGVEGWKAAASQ